MKYIGKGDHLVGVPARDLTDDEVAALPDFADPQGVDLDDPASKTYGTQRPPKVTKAREYLKASGLYADDAPAASRGGKS